MEIKDFSMYFSPHMMLQYIIFLKFLFRWNHMLPWLKYVFYWTHSMKLLNYSLHQFNYRCIIGHSWQELSLCSSIVYSENILNKEAIPFMYISLYFNGSPGGWVGPLLMSVLFMSLLLQHIVKSWYEIA